MSERAETMFTLKIEETHACGQVHEQIVHFKLDPTFSYALRFDPPLLPFADLEKSSPWTIPAETQTLLELSGHISKVEMNGIEMADHQIVCVKCGADILFPAIKEETTCQT